MSSEPVVPLNNAEKETDTSYVAPGTERELRSDELVSRNRPDRLIERESRDSRPLGEIPGEPAHRLRETAETVGSAVGRAVNMARDLPRRVEEMKERFTIIRGRAKEDAAATAEEVRETAKHKMRQAQTRVQFYAREYPIEFILGVGAFGFVIGMFLRAWRSSRRG
jgi:hypothetical protein